MEGLQAAVRALLEDPRPRAMAARIAADVAALAPIEDAVASVAALAAEAEAVSARRSAA